MNTNGNLLGDGTQTGEEVASLLDGAAGFPHAVGRLAPLYDRHCATSACPPGLERAVVRMTNNDVAAWPTRWYRIFPSLLSDASSSLREMLPPQIATTPLDDALHEWVVRDLQRSSRACSMRPLASRDRVHRADV